MENSRPGLVLIVALLLALVLSATGLAILAVGSREMALARALDRLHQARAAAESAARVAADSWSSRRYRSLDVGQDTAGPAAPGVEVTVAQLDSGLFLIRAAAERGAGRYPPAAAEVGLLVRALDPVRLARLFPGAVTADSLIRADSGVVDVAPCRGVVDPAPALRAPRVRLGSGPVLVGDPPVDTGPAGIRPIPPWLRPDRAGRLSTAVAGPGTVTPRPGAAGACDPGGESWGAVDPEHPCHDALPLILVRGPLAVDGGEGRGGVVVDGDIDLNGVRLSGFVMASGTLTIGAGTTVQGAVRAAVVEIVGGRITRDGCALEAGLTAGGLDRAFAPGDRIWVPVF